MAQHELRVLRDHFLILALEARIQYELEFLNCFDVLRRVLLVSTQHKLVDIRVGLDPSLVEFLPVEERPLVCCLLTDLLLELNIIMKVTDLTNRIAKEGGVPHLPERAIPALEQLLYPVFICLIVTTHAHPLSREHLEVDMLCGEVILGRGVAKYSDDQTVRVLLHSRWVCEHRPRLPHIWVDGGAVSKRGVLGDVDSMDIVLWILLEEEIRVSVVEEGRVGQISVDRVPMLIVVISEASSTFATDQQCHVGKSRSIHYIEVIEGKVLP